MSEIRSGEAVARIRGLVEQVSKLKSELSDAAQTHTLTIKNREVIKLTSGDPDAVIAKAKSSLDAVQSRLSGLRNQLNRDFVAESARRAQARSDEFARTYVTVVLPLARQFAVLAEGFELVVDQVVAFLDAKSDTMRRLDDDDAAIREWNGLVSELGPGNARLDEKPLSKTLRESLTHNIRFRERLEPAFSRLRDALNPPVSPPQRLTEEQIAEIRFDQKLHADARRKELDAEDARARSAIS